MREILFRGQTRRYGEKLKNVGGEKMKSNWVYGGIFPNNNGGDFAIIYQQKPDIKKFTVYADTVGQYTGLTDKNNKKIFEGDIVKHNQRYDVSGVKTSIATIKWNSAYTCWSIEYTNGRATAILGCENHRIEVIGNIHDNPELLKEE